MSSLVQLYCQAAAATAVHWRHVAMCMRSLVAIALRADDVVVVCEEAFADQTDVAGVARETPAVPVTTLERDVSRSFSSETCMSQLTRRQFTDGRWNHILCQTVD